MQYKLRNFCKQKNIVFIDNGKLNESDLGLKKLDVTRNSATTKNLLDYLEHCLRKISERDLFLKECISDSSEIQKIKDFPCNLKLIRKINLSRFIFAHINITFIRSKLEMLAEKVKRNADVVVISETKLDDVIPIDQFTREGFSKPFRIDRSANGNEIMLFIREKVSY